MIEDKCPRRFHVTGGDIEGDGCANLIRAGNADGTFMKETHPFRARMPFLCSREQKLLEQCVVSVDRRINATQLSKDVTAAQKLQQ